MMARIFRFLFMVGCFGVVIAVSVGLGVLVRNFPIVGALIVSFVIGVMVWDLSE